MQDFNLLTIVGTTASGKTKLAVDLARLLNGEVLSADSRQVYRGLDIGSGKDLDEYQEVPYHLIDIVDPGYEYNIFDFQRDFVSAFTKVQDKQKLAILAGGSALYVDSILKGYQLIEVKENPELRQQLANLSHDELTTRLITLKPDVHNTTDLVERDRMVRAIEIAEGELAYHASDQATPIVEQTLAQLKPLVLAIDWSREIVKQRITKRLKERLNQGLIEEVEQLHAQGVSWSTLEFYGLEYRFVSQYLQGNLTKNDLFQKLNSAIHLFAKKQQTWLRRLSRSGANIHFLDGNGNLVQQAMQVLAKHS